MIGSQGTFARRDIGSHFFMMGSEETKISPGEVMTLKKPRRKKELSTWSIISTVGDGISMDAIKKVFFDQTDKDEGKEKTLDRRSLNDLNHHRLKYFDPHGQEKEDEHVNQQRIRYFDPQGQDHRSRKRRKRRKKVNKVYRPDSTFLYVRDNDEGRDFSVFPAVKDEERVPIEEETSDDNADNSNTVVIKIIPVPAKPRPYFNKSRYYDPSFAFSSRTTGQRAESRSGGYGGGGGYGGMRGTSSALLAAVPLLLIVGLALGYFIRNGSGASGAGSVNNTNIIEINGTTVTNTFMPTNTAMATNNNMDMDTITNMARSLRRHTRFLGSIDAVMNGMLRAMGVSRKQFFRSFMESVKSASAADVVEQLDLLTRRMECAEKSNVTSMCEDRVVCEHFNEAHERHRGNMLVRAGLMWTATMWRILRGEDFTIERMSGIMDYAVKVECSYYFSDCKLDSVQKCLYLY